MKIIEILVVLLLIFGLYTHFGGENPVEKATKEVRGLQKTYTDSLDKLDKVKEEIDRNYKGYIDE